MKTSFLAAVALAALLAPTSARAVSSSSTKTCTELKIPLTVTSENWIWALPKFSNNYDVADFISNVESRTAGRDFVPVSGLVNQTASYTIAATICTPKGPSNKNLLLATHGLNFDRSYWDLRINPDKYSFVDHAIAKGYSVLFYDRLGTGESTM